MKRNVLKKLSTFVIVLLFAFWLYTTINTFGYYIVSAEEESVVVEQPEEEQTEIVEPVDNTEEPVDNTEEEQPKPIDEEELSEEEEKQKLQTEIIEKLKETLSQYVDKDKLEKIIQWIIDTGVLGALLGVYIKYKKYKNTTLDDLIKLFKKEIDKYLKEAFKNYESEISQIVININDSVKFIGDKTDKIIQAFALSQDKTMSGKVAMLDLIRDCTEDKKTIESIEKIKEDIAKTEEKKQEVLEKVSGEYNEIEEVVEKVEEVLQKPQEVVEEKKVDIF